MKCFIFTGGREIFPDMIHLRPQEGDFVIAADSGMVLAQYMEITPDVLIGDFDSCQVPPEFASVKVITFPPEKDDTDTMLAVKYALACGFTEIVILGGMGGRVDHTLANVFALEYAADAGAAGELRNGQNIVRYLRDGTLTLAKDEYHYVSVIPLDRFVRGVTLTGFKYPLTGAVLSRGMASLGVSNELVADAGGITVESGAVLVMQSRDILA